MPVQLKRGRWGKDEIAYMKANAGNTPLAEMAKKLNRDANTVNTWIKENLALDIGESGEAVPVMETEIRNEFRNTIEYQELRDQFLEAELKYFEAKYSKLKTQFKNDVTPSEETQIFLLIKLEILMNRNLKQRQRALVDVERLQKDIQRIYDDNGEDTNSYDDKVRDRLENLENQLQSARQAEGDKTGEYMKLSEKHAALMNALKGTREQRITKIENSKQTYLDLIKMLQDEDLRKEEGEDMELMKLAVSHAREKLSQSHKYVDDTIDQPLLTPDNTGENDDSSDDVQE
jgi:hypothetical protein